MAAELGVGFVMLLNRAHLGVVEQADGAAGEDAAVADGFAELPATLDRLAARSAT